MLKETTKSKILQQSKGRMSSISGPTTGVPNTKPECSKGEDRKSRSLVQALVSGLPLGYFGSGYKCGSSLHIKALSSNKLWITC